MAKIHLKIPTSASRIGSPSKYQLLPYVTKEPIGLFRSDGKRPDDLTLVPWQSGKSLCWDVTVSCLLAESYVSEAAREAGAAAELAATHKEVKYAGIVGCHIFEPIAIETLDVCFQCF